MRRTHLRGHPNILKRLLVHVGGFDLGLVMHARLGVGTPRGLQGTRQLAFRVVSRLWALLRRVWNTLTLKREPRQSHLSEVGACP
jgi:transposase